MKKVNLMKALSLILALLMMFSLVACGGDAAEDTKSDPSKGEDSAEGKRTLLTVAISDNVSTLTPLYKISWNRNIIQSEIFEHLGVYSEVGSDEFVGVLMKSWEEVDDVTYNIEIYDYITDSAGNHMTANDVKYSIEAAKEEGVGSAKYVESVETTGDYTLTMTVTDASVGIFEEICQNVWIVTQAAMEASSDMMATTPVGTGPYTLTEFVTSSHALVEKREDYWQKDELRPRCSQANVDVIRYDFLHETTQMGIAVEEGTVQAGIKIDEGLVPDLQGLDNVIIDSFETTQMRNMVFNCSEHSIFGGENGKLLRQAVCYAINNDAIIGAACHGIGGEAKAWGKADFVGYNDAWEDEPYYPYDVEKAKELLAEAGYPNGGFKISFWGTDNAFGKAYMQVVQANLAVLGIEVELNFVADNINAQSREDVSSGWDLYNISYTNNANFLSSAFKYYCDNRTHAHGGALFGAKDEHLQELTEAAISKDWTQEDMDALHNYVVENAFVYTVCENYLNIARSPMITDLFLNWRQDPQFGACEFSDDYNIYYEG